MKCPLIQDTREWSSEENRLLVSVMVWLNTVSLILGLWTVGILFFLKKNFLKTFSFYFCLVTSITHLGLLIGPMVGMDALKSHNSYACASQGAVLQFFVMSSVCWFFWLTIQLHSVIVLEHAQSRTNLLAAHIFSWGLPLIITVIDLALPGMVFRELWCWVPNCEKGLFEWLFYVPTMIIVIIVAFMWIRSLVKVFQYSKRTETKTFMLQNLLGVFILFISYTYQAGHRLYLISLDKNTPGTYSLELIHLISMSWLGTVCFFVFGFTTHNIDTFKTKVCNHDVISPNVSS